MVAAEAFPVFIINYLPHWLGGIVLAVLLVAVVGTAAGLSLGISTMFTKDIYCMYINKQASDKQVLLVSRVLLIAIVCVTMFFVAGNLKSMILQWSFLSMGLRGACVFLPLLGAIYLRKWVGPRGGVIALAAGPITVITWKLFNPNGIDPLYAGLLASFVVMLVFSIGYAKERSLKTN
jgi:SSS family solute:Na+ symporter